MKSVKLSQENWKQINSLKKRNDYKTHNEVVTNLLKQKEELKDIKDKPEFTAVVDETEEASCSECGFEFKFIIHKPEMYLCCPRCGKTNKIEIPEE